MLGDCAWKGGPPSLSQSPSAAFVTPVTGRKHFAEPSHGVNCPEAVFVYSPLDSVSSEVVPLSVIYLSATVCCASPQPSMFPEYVSQNFGQLKIRFPDEARIPACTTQVSQTSVERLSVHRLINVSNFSLRRAMFLLSFFTSVMPDLTEATNNNQCWFRDFMYTDTN